MRFHQMVRIAWAQIKDGGESAPFLPLFRVDRRARRCLHGRSNQLNWYLISLARQSFKREQQSVLQAILISSVNGCPLANWVTLLMVVSQMVVIASWVKNA